LILPEIKLSYFIGKAGIYPPIKETPSPIGKMKAWRRFLRV
jgi:hypothetical protein